TGALVDLHVNVVAGQSLTRISKRQISVSVFFWSTATINNIAARTNDIAHDCRCGWVSTSTIAIEHQRTCCLCFHKDSVVGLRNRSQWRSEEHTSELQSRFDLVCRLLLEKKKRRTDKE